MALSASSRRLLEAIDIWPALRDKAASGERSARPKPLALILGNEEHGLAPDVAAVCTRLVTIPGSGKVESLNVSVAAAILMWESFARRAPSAP